MSEPLHDTIHYGTVTIPFTTFFSPRTTVEVGVEPDGSVLVKAPLGTPYVLVRQRVARKARWIEKQRAFFRSLPRPTSREYVSGETHRYLGRSYRLKVEKAPQHEVKLLGPHLVARTPDGSSDATARALDRWYRQRATVKFSERLDLCAQRLCYLGIHRPQLKIRVMSTRWGSRTPSGRVYLHPNLVRAPVDCIDYVVTHELCHTSHPHHGPAFYALLDSVMPDWRKRRARLNGTAW